MYSSSNDDFAWFKVGDKIFKKYTLKTHTHSHTKKSWTSDGLKLYLNIAGQNGKEFSHHRERHIEYTVYVQTQFWTKYNFTVASRTMTTNCKPSLTKGNEQKTTTAIQILLK